MMYNERKMQPGRTNSFLFRLINETFYEVAYKTDSGIKDTYPNLTTLITNIEIHATPFPKDLSDYRMSVDEINKIYPPSIMMQPTEAILRLRAIFDLAKSIGILQLNKRYPYPDVRPSDIVTFNGFNFDISNVPNSNLLEQLTDFYSGELKKEYEDKGIGILERNKDSLIRAKRSVAFYEGYKEYEESGFDPYKIETIFKVSHKDQKLLDFWIRKLFPSGLLSSIFAEQGMGKSNLASFISQAILVMRPDWDIINNIPFIFMPKINLIPEYHINRFKIVENISQMLVEESKSILNDRIPSVIIDEFDSSYIAPQTRSTKGISFKTYIYVERHYDTQGPLVIYHRFKDIPVELRNKDVAYDTFKATWYSNPELKIYKRVVSNPSLWEMGIEGYRYFPIPVSQIPYFNQGFGSFEIDLDMQYINQHISGTKKQAAQNVIDIIKELNQKKRDENNRPKNRKIPDDMYS